MKKQIKWSLGMKMALIVSVAVCVVIVCSLFASRAFLGEYYLYGKQNLLIESYNEINKQYKTYTTSAIFSTKQSGVLSSDNDPAAYSGDEAQIETLDDGLMDRFEQMAENRSMSILIFRDTNDVIYDIKNNTQYVYKPIIYSSIGMDTQDKIENNNMYNDFVGASQQNSVIRRTNDYQILKVHVGRLNSDYIYLSATLDNGDHLLLRSSYDSMQEGVDISIRFIMYVSAAMLIIAIFVIFFLIQRMVHPIAELSSIAGQMAHMNFNKKYIIKSKDEIGALGNNINLLSENLEKTMAELKSANQQLRKDLEIKDKNDQMRKEFLSNVSHELKTPIALIQGYAEGLMENINDDEESREFYCEVIVDEANKMNNLVKKLLDLNQLEFGNNRVNMEHFNLVDVICNYLSSAEILFKQKDVTLQMDLPDEVYVWADEYMVEEIFNNYLSNALNHVDGEKIIKISVEQKTDCVRITVFNTGERIPEEDIGQIWDKFYKVDKARTREYGGSGVGLSIVKASMDLLGQKYGVENKEDGVEFFFELDTKNS